MDKTCIDCKQTKDVSCFYKRYDKGEGHYRNSCKECLKGKEYKKLEKPRAVYESEEHKKQAARERAREWYKNNTEKAKKRIKEYYQTEHGKEKLRIRRALKLNYEPKVYSPRREKNQKDIETEKIKRKKWLANNKLKNPDYWRIKKKRDKAVRRSRELNAGPLDTSSIITLEAYNLREFKVNGFVCEFCRSEVSFDYHLEHLIPISRNGTNRLDNLAISCASCNLQKLAKTVEEYRPDLSNYFTQRKL